MRRTLALAPLFILMLDQSHCHGLASDMAFEVAAVTPCKPQTPAPPGEDHAMVKLLYPGGRLDARATTVKYLLEWSYDLLPSQHSGDPAWMDNDRFDIVAKAPGNATEDQMKAMTRTLLADRFHLKFHRETRDAPVLIMTAGKTAPKLYPPKEGETTDMRIAPRSDVDRKVIGFNVVATRFSFAQLNRTFAHVLDRVIVNQTGLSGDFDFTLELTMDDNQPNPLDPSQLIAAMRDQLGLVLKSQKGPVDFLVIESVDKR